MIIEYQPYTYQVLRDGNVRELNTQNIKRHEILKSSGYKVRAIEKGVFGRYKDNKELLYKWIKYAVDEKDKPQHIEPKE